MGTLFQTFYLPLQGLQRRVQFVLLALLLEPFDHHRDKELKIVKFRGKKYSNNLWLHECRRKNDE